MYYLTKEGRDDNDLLIIRHMLHKIKNAELHVIKIHILVVFCSGFTYILFDPYSWQYKAGDHPHLHVSDVETVAYYVSVT